MNDIREIIRGARLTETAVLNLLTEAGVISDHVVTLEDIATTDLFRARMALIRMGAGVPK